MLSDTKPTSIDNPEVVRVDYIRPFEIRSDSEGFFTLVEAGAVLFDDGRLTFQAIWVQDITQKKRRLPHGETRSHDRIASPPHAHGSWDWGRTPTGWTRSHLLWPKDKSLDKDISLIPRNISRIGGFFCWNRGGKG